MKVGVLLAGPGLAEPELLRAMASRAESVQLDSIWLADHVLHPLRHDSTYPYSPDGKLKTPPYPEALTTLSFLAASTATIELGTAILVLPQRSPMLVAKQAATVQRLAGGRLRLGIGVGWLREEFELLGFDFESRGARADEAVDLMRLLWKEAAPVFKGRYNALDGDFALDPRPKDGHIPVVIGGHSPAAGNRAGRIGDGFLPMAVNPEELRRLYETASQARRTANRADAPFEYLAMCGLDRNQALALAGSGAQHLIIPAVFPTLELQPMVDKLEQIGQFRSALSDVRARPVQPGSRSESVDRATTTASRWPNEE